MSRYYKATEYTGKHYHQERITWVQELRLLLSDLEEETSKLLSIPFFEDFRSDKIASIREKVEAHLERVPNTKAPETNGINHLLNRWDIMSGKAPSREEWGFHL